jgi:hypothetical protein
VFVPDDDPERDRHDAAALDYCKAADITLVALARCPAGALAMLAAGTADLVVLASAGHARALLAYEVVTDAPDGWVPPRRQRTGRVDRRYAVDPRTR